ncbi:hypothetical protein J6590_089149 [Homalodisca vitripennis]|nr:hypothetical protein J6590_089149 [Homalodisca vitripennis]
MNPRIFLTSETPRVKKWCIQGVFYTYRAMAEILTLVCVEQLAVAVRYRDGHAVRQSRVLYL